MLVERRYGGANGRAADLAQVMLNPQRSYGRSDTGKADTLTCGRIPHRKDGGSGGGVQQHAHTGLNQQCLLNRHGDRTHLLGKHQILP
ncbi:hypothetical protein GW17_00056765 [Ensete ventricosum]|nr:hypothetical protein GW17_00056765 [Ensete ventricosum]